MTHMNGAKNSHGCHPVSLETSLEASAPGEDGVKYFISDTIVVVMIGTLLLLMFFVL